MDKHREEVLKLMRKSTKTPGTTSFKDKCMWIFATTNILPPLYYQRVEEKSYIVHGLAVLYLSIIWVCALTVSMTLLFDRWGFG